VAREDWTAGAYLLTQGVVRDVEVREGLYGVAAVRGEDAATPRHGRRWRRKPLDAGAFGLSLWLGANTRAELEAGYDELLRAVGRLDGLVRWQRTLAGGSSRECYGYLGEGPQPDPLGQLAMRLGLAVVVPAGLWQGVADVPALALAVGATTNLDGELGTSTGPLTGLRVTITGPSTDTHVTDPRTGRGFTLQGTVAAGTTAVVDSGAWTVTGTSDRTVANLLYDGPTFLEVTPGKLPGAYPQLAVAATNTTAATAVSVTGRASFLA
jgi:hypothetical protein